MVSPRFEQILTQLEGKGIAAQSDIYTSFTQARHFFALHRLEWTAHSPTTEMKAMYKSLLTLTVSALITFGASAGHHPGPHHQMALLKQLDLSREQRQDVRQLMRQGRQDVAVYREDLRAVRQQMQALIKAESWDEAAVKDLLEERQPLMAQLALTRANKKHQVWQVLSDEQQAEFEALMQDREPREFSDRQQKMLERLDLSDAQQQQIDQIRTENAANKAAFRQLRQDLKQAEAELIKADSFDQDAWQGLRAEYQQVFADYALKGLYARHQVWQVLSDEQQAEAEQRMQKRKHKRAERFAESGI